jgi:hypothetical protein
LSTPFAILHAQGFALEAFCELSLEKLLKPVAKKSGVIFIAGGGSH